MNTALTSLIRDINEQETQDHPEPILVTENIIKEITNGMSSRAFCSAFGLSATRVKQGKTHEYLALTPKSEPSHFDSSRL